MPEMIFVASTNVEMIGYDPNLEELHVKFLSSNTIYVYLGCPQYVWDELEMAPSKGTYINRIVKPAYSCEKR